MKATWWRIENGQSVIYNGKDPPITINSIRQVIDIYDGDKWLGFTVGNIQGEEGYKMGWFCNENENLSHGQASSLTELFNAKSAWISIPPRTQKLWITKIKKAHAVHHFTDITNSMLVLVVSSCVVQAHIG